MTYYRLYSLDSSGHIKGFREFDAIGDVAAIEQCERWRNLDAMELWSGRSKIKGWEAFGLSPEAIARSAVRTIRASFGGPIGI